MSDPILFKNGYVAVATATGASYTQLPGVREVSMSLDKTELESRTYGDPVRTVSPGLIQSPVEVVCNQSADLDTLTFGAFLDHRVYALKVRPSAGAVSSTNPSYIFSRVGVFGVSPCSGKHGEIVRNPVRFVPYRGCTITRSTST